MSCQAKATPLSHTRVGKMGKFGSQELLQRHFERVWVLHLFGFLNYSSAGHFDSFQSPFAVLSARVEMR